MKEAVYELSIVIGTILLIFGIIYLASYVMCSIAGIEVLTASQAALTAIGFTIVAKLMDLIQKHVYIKW